MIRNIHRVCRILSSQSYTKYSMKLVFTSVVFEQASFGKHVTTMTGSLGRQRMQERYNRTSHKRQQVRISCALVLISKESLNNFLIPKKPQFRQAIQERHDVPFACHSAAAQVYADLRTNLLWPRMKQDFETHVSTCDLCPKNKPYNQGSLPPVRQRPWEVISTDVIPCLGQSSGLDYPS